MDAHELIESMGKMIAAYDMLTSSVEVNQRAILDLVVRMDEAVKKIYELELASPCPLLKSICEDWEYDAKPSPDKQEMVERYTVRICEEASVKHPNKLVEALVDFRKDILRQFAEEVRRG